VVYVPASSASSGGTYTSGTQSSSLVTITNTFNTIATGDKIWFILTADPLNCNGIILDLDAVDSASVCNDPIFTGFLGQKFSFNGKVGEEYHLFSDESISVNAYFASAVSSTYLGGTIIHAFDVRWAGITLWWTVDSVAADGSSMELQSGSSKYIISEAGHSFSCVNVTWSAKDKEFVITTPAHKMTFPLLRVSDIYINTTFWNFAMHIPLKLTNFGGIIGGTALDLKYYPIDEDVIVLPPLTGSAVSDRFNGVKFNCAATFPKDKLISATVAPK